MALQDLTLAQFTESLGSKSPTPGGGAVGPIVATIASALATMVLNYSVGKKKLADHDDLHHEALDALSTMATRANELADEDARAYERLNALMKLDASDPARQAGWADAVDGAIAPPSQTMDLGVSLLQLLERLTNATNRMLASDLAIAAILGDAVVHAGAWNVRINLSLIDDASRVATIEADVAMRESEATNLRRSIEAACRAES